MILNLLMTNTESIWYDIIVLISIIFFSFLIYAIHDWFQKVIAKFLKIYTGKLKFNLLGNIKNINNCASTAMLAFIGGGWKSQYDFKTDNRGKIFLISVCGPCSCFLVSFISYFVSAIISAFVASNGLIILNILLLIFRSLYRVSLMIGIFSLFPMFPFDGGHIIWSIVPEKWQKGLESSYKISFFSIILFITLVCRSGITGTINLII